MYGSESECVRMNEWMHCLLLHISLCAGKGYLKGSGTNDGMSIDREYTHTSTKMSGARAVSYTHLDVYKRQHTHVCELVCT